MLKGTIIENSLSDKSILRKLKILETREVGDWVLHDVLVDFGQPVGNQWLTLLSKEAE